MSYHDEATLIATMVNNGMTPDACECLGLLSDDMFTDHNLRDVFQTIKKLHNNGVIVDVAAVADNMQMIGAFSFLAETIMGAATTGQPIAYAQQMRRQFNSAHVVEELTMIANQLSESPLMDTSDLVGKLSELSTAIDYHSQSREPRSMLEMAQGYTELLDKRLTGDAEHQGLDIGLDVLINRTDLVVIGGTPGMGKTALLMFIINLLASRGDKSLVFSLEMEDMQIFEREVSRMSKVPTRALKNPISFGEDKGHVFACPDQIMDQVTTAVGMLADMPVYIDDSPGLTLGRMRAVIRRHLDKHPDTKLIAVDYLTLMTMPNKQQQHLAVAEVTRNCKLMAKEFKTPIVMLSQMNRAAATQKREPEISDLRDSGAIEQDADKIIFPYREEVYFPESKNKGLAKILKRKVRDDEPGEILLTFNNGNFYPHNGAEWTSPVADDDENKRKAPKV